MRIFISAGEASGDLYASRVVEAFRARHKDADFWGCAGPRMQAAGVRAIVDSRSISVVGLVEVVAHIPRIYREFRKLKRAIDAEKPDVAVLTDSPDFHFRLARFLHRRRVPVVYLIAPQAWAWRQGRVRTMRANIDRLLCIFPFEEEFFNSHGVPATYIGHPLARIVKPSMAREEFLVRFNLPKDKRLVVLLPGSRHGEVERHLGPLLDATRRLAGRDLVFVMALSGGFGNTFSERIRAASIQLIEGVTWDALAHADLALAASGTVTMEAAMLGCPLVTFYKVNALTWILGRWLVRAPFLSMVNLVAGRKIAPELIQNQMTGENIAREAIHLLDDPAAYESMKTGLKEVTAKLESERDPMEVAAEWVERVYSKGRQ
ncbi:MAG TPA: lipid-A-disaccharide synthase [Bryobacteraceae bacterium]|nr:lipid-A-disaccharide synthase [Bryobacteraceae bacterium]